MKYFNSLQEFHKESLKKISYSILISFFVLMSMFYFSSFTAHAGTSENAGSFSDLTSAVANVDNGGEIIITNNFEMSGIVQIPHGKEFTIRSTSGSSFTLERAENFKGSFFSIPDSSTVSFTFIKLDGMGYNVTQSLIENGGTLNLNAGVMLANNKKNAPAYAGGGVSNYGTLNMADGASISNCFAGSYGGGAVQNEGNFIMTGGIIIGNTGEGAVQNAGSGTFTMSGGSITGNMDPYGDLSGVGAGVHHYGSAFNLSRDASISFNNVNLNDRIIGITGALSRPVAVYAPSDAADGTIIATGVGYTLQESDKSVFSVEGFSLLLEDNNIVLQTTSSAIPSEPIPSEPIPTEPTPSEPILPEPIPDTLIPVTGVTLDKESAEIYVGKTLQLIAAVVPSDGTNKGVTWSSSNPEIAEVDENGIVTGIKTGTATITVMTDDGGHTATCLITVLEIVPPKTGDDSNQLPWVTMGLISLFAGLYLQAQKKLQRTKA